MKYGPKMRNSLAVLLLIPLVECLVPTCSLIDEMKAKILELVDGKISRIPNAVRFGFHSCVGGCNGCINLKEADNNGFDDLFKVLNQAYDDLQLKQKNISRADFWALTATVATESAINKHGGDPVKVPCFKYHWGREDCSTSPDWDQINEFPSPAMPGNEMFDYFKREFGYRRDEVVAILGAHALGNAQIRNSGHSGSWTPSEEDVFNTTYYENMATRKLKWLNKDATSYMNDSRPHWQWEAELPSGQVAMMFNTDFELFFDLDLDENGKSRCKIVPECYMHGTCGENNVCPMAETYGQAAKYIIYPNLFYKDFHDAWDKMLRNKNKKLIIRGGTCSCS